MDHLASLFFGKPLNILAVAAVFLFDSQSVAEFERGYRDGLHREDYHNYNNTEAYSDGYGQGGIQAGRSLLRVVVERPDASVPESRDEARRDRLGRGHRGGQLSVSRNAQGRRLGPAGR